MMLFAFFGLWGTGLAAGAIAIPIVIHLINRRRYKIVPWAAMKFLLAAQKQTRKRMRIEQLLLLLVRMAIVALVILAMAAVMPWAEAVWANPYLNPVLIGARSLLGLENTGRGPVRQHRVHHIFVLDASLSMNQTVEGKNAFEIARQMALKKISDNPAGDGYSVLLLKENPTWLIGEASQDARKVAREIEAVKPSHGNSSLSAALSMIAMKLNESKRFPQQAVYFFTDMQRSTWLAAAPSDFKTDPDGKEKEAHAEIQRKATTVFVDCGPAKDSDNLAVTNVEFDQTFRPYIAVGMDLTVKATVRNYGTEPAKKVRAELLIGKAKSAANDAPLQMRVAKQDTQTVLAQSQQEFEFPDVRFPADGTYAVQVKIAGDALEPDNARTIIITVRETIPILLVNGKTSADRFERASEYVQLALNPFPPGAEPKWLPLRPEVVTPAQFGQMDDAALEKFHCIFWCDVGTFGPNEVKRLETHLRRGGGFIVALGDKAAENLERYNELLYKKDHGLLPASLLRRIDAPPEHHFYLSTTDNSSYALPPLKAFANDQDQLTLRTAHFRQFVQAAAAEGKARTILSFMPIFTDNEKVKEDKTLPINAPALIEWNPPLNRAQQPAPPLKAGERAERQLLRYRGKVILMTSTLNMDWNRWPGSPSYGPMMHELTRLAISGRLREQSTNVGGILEAFLPGGAEVDVQIKFPAEIEGIPPGKRKTQLIDDVNIVRWADTDFSGVYRFETESGVEIPFAVNVPTGLADQRGAESDLTRVDEPTLKQHYPGWAFQIVRDARMALLGGGPEDSRTLETPLPLGPDLAGAALLLVLLLLFVEIVLAWYFGHYTTTEGALTNAPEGPAATFMAAAVTVVASIVVFIGAAILLNYFIYGDFLGFVPDALRGWFERRMGIQDVLTAEGSKWEYQRKPFLAFLPGKEEWYAALLTIAALVTVFFTYKAEAPRVSLRYKLLLGVVRIYLILFTLWFLLPQGEVAFARTGWPDVVLLIDDTRSMGESDTFQDPGVIERVKKLSESIREKLIAELPEKIAALETEIAAKKPAAETDPDVKMEMDGLSQRLQYWLKQRENLNANRWRPSRLQLVQAILAQPEPHWLKTLLTKHESKLHIFHLDVHGRATKLRDADGDAGDILSAHDARPIERALKGIAQLEPYGEDSRLGVAVKQVIDHYNGAGLANVVMFTDGVTTRDETLSQIADYAAQKGVSLFFIGVGDESDQRDLKLHDLEVEDQIYVGDNIVFKVKLTGHGYKDLTVPVVLRVKEKSGKEKEVTRQKVKVDPAGKSQRITFTDKTKEVGRKTYIIQVEPPKLEANEKPLPSSNLRLERTIEVIDTKMIRVLYVEGQPRYEFRFLKFLLEREAPDEKNPKQKKKSIELRTLLLDADDDWRDKTALTNFPPTLDDLNQFDVLILGDCDPNHKKLQNRLKDIVNFVNGETEKGQKASKAGGGILFIAGAFNNPHRYKGTPLEKILPVEPLQDRPPLELPLPFGFRPQITTIGFGHPIFRFGPDDRENMAIWQRLTPMYWNSSGYSIKPLAEALAVTQKAKAVRPRPGQDPSHPLIVQMPTGSGRSMFFGFDETWRWRLREDEAKYNTFWIQTMRYLSRGQPMHTKLSLEKQTPYRVGEKIKVFVRFPDTTQGEGNKPGPKIDDKTEVKVTVTYQPPGAKEGDPQNTLMQLKKSEGTRGMYEGTFDRTREGKYRFRLTNPDVSASQPDGEKPSAEAIVELPPGELDRLRMDYQEMMRAAEVTNGWFFTLATADELLEKMPRGAETLLPTNQPPLLLWNQWWSFAIVLLLITSEWILRKMKHLL